MSDLQAPIINWQVMKGDSNAGFAEQRVLIIAQGSGTNAAKTVISDIQPAEVDTLCGAGSMAARAHSRFYKYNKYNEIDVLTLAEPVSGTAATGGLAVIGEALENATLKLSVADDEYEVNVTVLKGDDAEAVAAKIVTAVNAKFDTVEQGNFISAAVDTDTTLVKMTFGVKGEIANGLTTSVKSRVLGLSFNAQPFTGGAGAYDMEGALAKIKKRYQTVLFDTATDFDELEEWLQSRVNMSNTVKGGIGISMMNGDLATVKAFANTKNSRTMVLLGNLDEMKYNAIPLLAAAEFGAKRALRLTDGAILGDLVLEAQEAYGGINKSSLPYHNTPMSYDEPKDELIIEQAIDLNDAGVSLFVPATIGVVLGTMVTLYKFDNSGIEDSAFKYLNAMDTSLAVQEYLFSNCQKEFGQTRATGGDLVAGVAMTNELAVKAYLVGLYEYMVDYALVQGGKEAMKAFKARLTVTLNSATGFYNVYAPVAIVSQFRGLNGVVAISYEF